MAKNKEKIYNLLSPKILEKKSRRAEMPDLKKTPEVDNFKASKSTVAKPTNIKVVPSEPLLISPQEGKQAVNGQAENIIIKKIGIENTLDPGVAAIPVQQKKKPGRPKKDN